MEISERLISCSEAARLLKVHPSTMSRRVQAGEIPAWRNGADRRAVLVRESDIHRLREPRPIKSGPIAA